MESNFIPYYIQICFNLEGLLKKAFSLNQEELNKIMTRFQKDEDRLSEGLRQGEVTISAITEKVYYLKEENLFTTLPELSAKIEFGKSFLENPVWINLTRNFIKEVGEEEMGYVLELECSEDTMGGKLNSGWSKSKRLGPKSITAISYPIAIIPDLLISLYYGNFQVTEEYVALRKAIMEGFGFKEEEWPGGVNYNKDFIAIYIASL